MFKKLTSLFMVLILVTSSIGFASAPSDWAESGIKTLKELDIIYPRYFESPRSVLTREDFSSILVLFTEMFTSQISSYALHFSDTTESGPNKAAQIGLLSGTGPDIFSPNVKVTREQAASILVSMLNYIEGYSGMDLTKQQSVPIYADDSRISSWAKSSVYAISSYGYMSGVGGGNFNPKGEITTEQFMVMLSNIYNKAKMVYGGTDINVLDYVGKHISFMKQTLGEHWVVADDLYYYNIHNLFVMTDSKGIVNGFLHEKHRGMRLSNVHISDMYIPEGTFALKDQIYFEPNFYKEYTSAFTSWVYRGMPSTETIHRVVTQDGKTIYYTFDDMKPTWKSFMYYDYVHVDPNFR